jgi:hypothetical protein
MTLMTSWPAHAKGVGQLHAAHCFKWPNDQDGLMAIGFRPDSIFLLCLWPEQG